MATKTVGLTGCDFTTMAGAASYFNSLAFTTPLSLGVASGGAVVDTVTVTFGGWTGGSSTNTLTISPIPGQGARDNASVLTNPLRFDASKGAALTFTAGSQACYNLGANVILDGLQVQATSATAGSVLTPGSSTVVRNCIMRTQGPNYVVSTSGNDVTVENCTINCAGGGTGALNAANSRLVVTDCLLISTGGTAATYAIRNIHDNPVVKNTAVFGFTTDFQATGHVTCTNNATDKATFGGTNFGTAGQTSITSAEWTSITSGSEDFRLAAGSVKLKANGATTGPTTDIVGNTRTAPYSIGPAQYPVPGVIINATTGNAAATGVQASIQGTTTISAAVGNAAATGLPATVTNGVPTTTINATVGTAAATGSTAAVGTFIQTDNIPNNTGTVLANTAVVWTWTPAGRIGSMTGLTATDGTGTTDANGRLAPGIALAAGTLLVADRASSAGAKTDPVFYQAF